MELYFLASGVKHELDYFENQMQFMHFNLPFKTADGKEMIQPLYGLLAPIQLYKFVFPKEYLDEVLKTLDLPNEGNYLSQFDAQAFALRKILRADKIPKPKADVQPRRFHRGNIAIKGIGIKPDEEVTMNGMTHEGI
jgi:hypothetical protein